MSDGASRVRFDGLSHALLPAIAWLGLIAAVAYFGLDTLLSDRLYDAGLARWQVETGSGAYLVLYRGGRALVIGTVLALLLLVAGSVFRPSWRSVRRPASYLLACILLTTGLAGLGKHLTNMDCPRALQRYGGDRPELGLFEDRPQGLPRALCFPGGHSSGGFSFLALYFLLGERRRSWRWAGLGAGLTLGFSFAGVQWARGQHFVSHDLVSAAIGWAVALGAYTVLYRSSVWKPPGSGRDAPAAD